MNNTDKEDRLILSRAEDAVMLCERKYQIKTIGFLNPHQRVMIKKNIYPSADIRVTFEGGWEDAERTLMVCVPEFLDIDIDEILKVIKVTGRDVAVLSHRDYLGSLMGLGITRENIGDIIVSDSGAYIFVKADIADYILNNIDKIGRYGVKTAVCKCAEAEIPKPKTKEIGGTVSSLRLDSVLSVAAGISRSRAVELINSGAVSINFEVCESVSEKIAEGDLISVRGIGRMRLERIGNLTRKGRTGITVARFE